MITLAAQTFLCTRANVVHRAFNVGGQHRVFVVGFFLHSAAIRFESAMQGEIDGTDRKPLEIEL